LGCCGTLRSVLLCMTEFRMLNVSRFWYLLCYFTCEYCKISPPWN